MASEVTKKNDCKKIFVDNKGGIFISEDVLKSWISRFIVTNFTTIPPDQINVEFFKFATEARFQINIFLKEIPLHHELIKTIQKELQTEIISKFRISVASINIVQILA